MTDSNDASGLGGFSNRPTDREVRDWEQSHPTRGSAGSRIEHDFTGNKNPFIGEDEDITPELTLTSKQTFWIGAAVGLLVGMLSLFIVLSVVARA